MARASFITYILDEEGRPIPGATVYVRTPDTESLISETLYAADTGGTTKTNPFTADADGRIEFYLDVPKVIDLHVTKTGYDNRDRRAVVDQLTTSTLVLLDDGVSKPQRSGVNFQNGFVLTDNAGADKTEIDLDFGGTPSTSNFAEAASPGTSTQPAQADHVHGREVNPVISHEAAGNPHPTYATDTDLTTHAAAADPHDPYLKDKDHGGLGSETPQHDHSAAAQAGTVDHGALTGLTDDDHTQYLKEEASGGTAAEVPDHTHASGAEAGTVSHDVLTGVSVNDHHNEVHQPTKHDAVAARVHNSVNQTISNASDTQVSFDTEDFDDDGMHVAGSPSILTIPAGMAGKWLFTGLVVFAADANGNRQAAIRVNGTTVETRTNVPSPGGSAVAYVSAVPTILQLAVGDFVQLIAFQSSGGNLAVLGGAGNTQLMATYLGA